MRANETELEMVWRHVRQGERHIASQQDIVELLREHGHATALAEELLANLQELQAMHLEHLERIS